MLSPAFLAGFLFLAIGYVLLRYDKKNSDLFRIARRGLRKWVIFKTLAAGDGLWMEMEPR